SKLEMCGLRPVFLSAFEVKHGSCAGSGPQPFAFPAGVRNVDAPVDILREEAARIRNSEGDNRSVHERKNSVVEIAHGYGHVLAEPKCVESVNPGVVARLGASRILHIS